MAELEEDKGPFDPSNAAAWQLIVQMRIYDVLMGIMSHLDTETADIIYDAHQAGRLVSEPPKFGVAEDESFGVPMEDDNGQ